MRMANQNLWLLTRVTAWARFLLPMLLGAEGRLYEESPRSVVRVRTGRVIGDVDDLLDLRHLLADHPLDSHPQRGC